MSEDTAIERLLEEIRGASSPIQRIRVLRRAWRTLRDLGPARLSELATRAGLDRADGVLARLASREGRMTPSLLRQLLRLFQDTGPQQIRAAVQDLGVPPQRGAGLPGGEEGVPAERQGESAAADDEPRGPAGAAEGSEPPEDPTAVPAVEVGDRDEPPARAASPPPRRHVETAAVVPPGDPAPRTVPVPVPSEPSLAADGSPHVADRLAALQDASTSLLRLRCLDRAIDAVRTLELAELHRLVESFPDGWARRRAVVAVLRAGVPSTPSRALRLIERLVSATDRRWCVGTLVDHRALDARTRRELLERHGLPGYRRSKDLA